ncbi:MAG TPA: hypothetical protein VF498_02970 [Anaerolineales bacterium]
MCAKRNWKIDYAADAARISNTYVGATSVRLAIRTIHVSRPGTVARVRRSNVEILTHDITVLEPGDG